MSKQINRNKASSHPSSVNGIYKAEVRSVVNGLPVVFVRELGITVNDVRFVGNSKATNVLKKGDEVLCTFVDNKTEEMIVVGRFNKKTEVFVTVEKFNALIDQLQTQLNAIRSAMTPPLSSVNLQSFKQEAP
jgi:hypothetical protein